MSKKVNHIILNDELQIDLRNDTVTPETLVSGVTAHDRSGEIIEGTLTLPSGTVSLPANGRYDVTNFEFADVALPTYDKTVEAQGATDNTLDFYLNPQITIPFGIPSEWDPTDWDWEGRNSYYSQDYSYDNYNEGDMFPSSVPGDIYYTFDAHYYFSENEEWQFGGFDTSRYSSNMLAPLLESINNYPVTTIDQFISSGGDADMQVIFIPKHIVNFSSNAFRNMYYLKCINYAGTMDEWHNINKMSGWHSSCPETIVYCEDGTVIVPAGG